VRITAPVAAQMIALQADRQDRLSDVAVQRSSIVNTMLHSLSSLVPKVAVLFTLKVEELAGVLLVHLNDYQPTVRIMGGITTTTSSMRPTSGLRQPTA